MDRETLQQKYKITILSEEDELDIVRRMQNGEIARALLDAHVAQVNEKNLKHVLNEKGLNDYYEEKKASFIGRTSADMEVMIADSSQVEKSLLNDHTVPGIIFSIARQSGNERLSFLELIHAGNRGFIGAVKKISVQQKF